MRPLFSRRKRSKRALKPTQPLKIDFTPKPPPHTAVPADYDWHQDYELVPGEKSHFIFGQPEFYIVAEEHADFIRDDGAIPVGFLFAHKHTVSGMSCQVEVDVAIRKSVVATKQKGKHTTPWIFRNIEAMDLSPSIVCTQDGCKAHGFIKNGEWSDVASSGKKEKKEEKPKHEFVISPVPATRRD